MNIQKKIELYTLKGWIVWWVISQSSSYIWKEKKLSIALHCPEAEGRAPSFTLRAPGMVPFQHWQFPPPGKLFPRMIPTGLTPTSSSDVICSVRSSLATLFLHVLFIVSFPTSGVPKGGQCEWSTLGTGNKWCTVCRELENNKNDQKLLLYHALKILYSISDKMILPPPRGKNLLLFYLLNSYYRNLTIFI